MVEQILASLAFYVQTDRKRFLILIPVQRIDAAQ